MRGPVRRAEAGHDRGADRGHPAHQADLGGAVGDRAGQRGCRFRELMSNPERGAVSVPGDSSNARLRDLEQSVANGPFAVAETGPIVQDFPELLWSSRWGARAGRSVESTPSGGAGSVGGIAGPKYGRWRCGRDGPCSVLGSCRCWGWTRSPRRWRRHWTRRRIADDVDYGVVHGVRAAPVRGSRSVSWPNAEYVIRMAARSPAARRRRAAVSLPSCLRWSVGAGVRCGHAVCAGSGPLWRPGCRSRPRR